MTFTPHCSAPEAHAALRRSLAAEEEARRCAVLWFGEIMRRRLYRDLGYASINQYAARGLGFSRSRTGDFIRLARRLEDMPATRAAVATGELGYTKAREVITVATPATEQRWLEAANKPRRELIREVKRARRAARVDPRQGELLAEAPPVAAARELPVRFQVDLTPEQEARRAALVERLHKLPGVPGDRAELLLEALAALVEAAGSAPRGAPTVGPPVQIHVHEDAATGRMSVPTGAGDRELAPAETERMRCDAAVCATGHRNTTTIPPRIRRRVLARDRHCCRAPGCQRTRFLEVHHVRPRRQGGSNRPENLVTLCAACHRLWHEQGGMDLAAFAAEGPRPDPRD